MKKKTFLTVCLAAFMATSFSLTACGGDPAADLGTGYTSHDYISTTPSTWNELDSTDANNDAIMGYIGSNFYEYDYKFDEAKGGKFKADGSINADAIVPGAFEVKYSAATKLEDVTAKYGEAWGLTADQVAAGGYAWKITLRPDLEWEDGTPIKAEDFVYSMQEQLNPLFQLGRSDSYYNNAVKIHKAKDYVYQGQSGYFPAVDLDAYGDNLSSLDGLFFDATNVAAFSDIFGTSDMTKLAKYKSFFQVGETNLYDELVAYAGDKRVAMTKELSDKLASLFAAGAPLSQYWGWADEEIGYFTVASYTYPAVDFKDVGIFAEGDLGVVVVCDNPMTFFKEDGTLSYLAAYNFQNLPLVKKALYEKCKVKPQAGSKLWTTTYNTSLDTSASWGPYKLTAFQAGKQFTLSRNDKWFGYKLDDNKGQYQTDKIVTDVIVGEEPQQLAFWSGEVDSLGISVVIAPDYKESPYAVYSPRVATFGVNIYSGLDTLLTKGRNNGVLAIKEFREAMSLSLDRNAYNKDLTTANQTCLGYMGEDYYYDVENSGVYRYTDQAKAALLRTYGFSLVDGKWNDGTKSYDSIDDAVKAMTGLNRTLAKQKIEEAWTELSANKDKYGYDDTKKIQICLGSAEDDALAQRQYNWINNWLTELVKGTSFEGKVELTKNFTLGDKWADEFKAGNYDICTGGIGNAPFDPFYLIGGWIGIMDSVNFHPYWAVDKEVIEYTLPVAEGFAESGKKLKLTVKDWYNSLNGNMSDGASYNWKAAPVEVRLDILAMLEEYGLKQYYTLPTSRGFTAALHSAKFHYVSDEYNTMMGFGGIRYIKYDYNDTEWAKFVKDHGGDLKEFYKKGN